MAIIGRKTDEAHLCTIKEGRGEDVGEVQIAMSKGTGHVGIGYRHVRDLTTQAKK